MKVPLPRIFLIALLAILSACYGDSNANRKVPTFALAVAPAGVRIPSGGSGTVQITLSRLNGFSEAVDVKLTGVPVGVHAQGRITPGETHLSLPIAIATELGPQQLSQARVEGWCADQRHGADCPIEILAALPPDSFSPKQVLAGGLKQSGGAMTNQAVILEPVQATEATAGNTAHRSGFHPQGPSNSPSKVTP